MQKLVQLIQRKPTPNLGPVETVFSVLLTYRTDPGEAAYWLTRQNGSRFMREMHGKEWTGSDPTAKSNALYYWKRATKWGDDESAEYWLDKYIDLGGTDQGMQQSIRMAAPQGHIPKKYQDEWLQWMNEDQLQRFDRASEWYENVYEPSQ